MSNIIGNHLDHIAADVQGGANREEVWLGLRNAYFREGSEAEAWAQMSDWFNTRGVIVSKRLGMDAKRQTTLFATFSKKL